jgi:hypothetical protein
MQTYGTGSLAEIAAADGTGFRTIMNLGPNEYTGLGAWTSDGMYLVFSNRAQGRV